MITVRKRWRKGRYIAPLSGAGISKIVHRLASAAGAHERRLAPHRWHEPRSECLRRSLTQAGFVTEALRDGNLSIPDVQEVTGHKSVSALLTYRREANAAKNNASRRLLGVVTGAAGE